MIYIYDIYYICIYHDISPVSGEKHVSLMDFHLGLCAMNQDMILGESQQVWLVKSNHSNWGEKIPPGYPLESKHGAMDKYGQCPVLI